MSTTELDDVDKGILHMLQQDARETTAAAMAEETGVSASTVRNRIAQLEAEGVIDTYVPHLDYERAGYQHHMVIICHAPMGTRSEIVEDVMETDGVVTIREMMTGTANIRVEVVGEDSDEIDRITEQLADLDLEIRSIDLVKHVHVQPFDHFGAEIVDGE